MNNQQTQFSVRVRKEDFLVKAKDAYDCYSRISDVKDKYQYFRLCIELEVLEKSLVNFYEGVKKPEILDEIRKTRLRIMSYEKSQDILSLISMVSISSDKFVTVTEDIYKLIYECDS